MKEQQLAKAQLIALKQDFSEFPEGSEDGKVVAVQFNPESLKLNYANEIVQEDGADQGGGTSQFVGVGSTTMALDLWFDVTAETKNRSDDVRILTKDVIYFMTPKESPEDSTKKIVPAVRFLWGSFLFEGFVESLSENLEFFSPNGKPLRASMSLGFKQQKIVLPTVERDGSIADAVGRKKLTPAKSDESLQQMAANSDNNSDWQDIAAANDIEDPLRMPPGKLVDMNPKKSIGRAIGNAGGNVGIGGGLSGGVGLGGSLGLGVPGISAGVSAGVSGSAGLGGALGLSTTPPNLSTSATQTIRLNPQLPKLSIE